MYIVSVAHATLKVTHLTLPVPVWCTLSSLIVITSASLSLHSSLPSSLLSLSLLLTFPVSLSPYISPFFLSLPFPSRTRLYTFNLFKSCERKSLGEHPHQSTMCLYWQRQPSLRFQLVTLKLVLTND